MTQFDEREGAPLSEEDKDKEHVDSLVRMAQTALAARYCENNDCGVLMYQPMMTEHTEPQVMSNCPGCGRFGRTKGQ